MNKIDKLTEEEKAYIGGFLDGDGSINAQIVRRKDYRFKFQIRVTITFFQKSTRHWMVLWLKKKLQFGTVRKRNDSMSEYVVVGDSHAKIFIEHIKPYLKVKRRQAVLALQIIEHRSKPQDLDSFFKSCQLADKFEHLNDSKKRSINLAVVRSELGFLD